MWFWFNLLISRCIVCKVINIVLVECIEPGFNEIKRACQSGSQGVFSRWSTLLIRSLIGVTVKMM